MNFDTRLTSGLTETNSSYLVLVVHIRGSYVTSVCGIVSMIHAFVSEGLHHAARSLPSEAVVRGQCQ